MANEIPPLDDAQRDFLRVIYASFHLNSMWPTMTELHRQLAQDGRLNVYEAGQQIDRRYVLPHVDGRGGVALRLLGIREGRGPCEEAAARTRSSPVAGRPGLVGVACTGPTHT